MSLPILHLDEASPTPLYLQLLVRLRGAVTAGALRPGEAIPGERDLAARARGSRVTVRRAVGQLVREGLLLQRQGAGTFVAPRVEQPLSVLSGFSEDMRARGVRAGSVWLERSVEAPSPDEVLALDLTGGARVVRLARVRTADGAPMAIERAAVPQAMLGGPEAVGDSLYAALSAAGVRPVRAFQRLRAEVASAADAALLAIGEGAAVLHVERRSFLGDGRPVEFTRSRYRGDRYDFLAELKSG